MNSCIYEGTVRHRRHEPRPHHLHYRLFMMYLDLDELDSEGVVEMVMNENTETEPDVLWRDAL